MINLFQPETYPDEKSNFSDDAAIRYHDSDHWPAHSPVGIWFNYGVLNNFLKEWTLRKEELKSGKITRDEYLNGKSTGHRPVMIAGNESLLSNGIENDK